MELAIKTTESGDIDGDGGRLKAVADNEFVVAAKRDLEVGVAVLRSRHWAVSGMKCPEGCPPQIYVCAERTACSPRG